MKLCELRTRTHSIFSDTAPEELSNFHLASFSFTGDSKLASSMRYVETQSMQIGASYMIQFSLVMGCGQKYTPHMDNQVKLEYSTNHGLTWHLVQDVCMASLKLGINTMSCS